jgi:hypothetical protein
MGRCSIPAQKPFCKKVFKNFEKLYSNDFSANYFCRADGVGAPPLAVAIALNNEGTYLTGTGEVAWNNLLFSFH